MRKGTEKTKNRKAKEKRKNRKNEKTKKRILQFPAGLKQPNKKVKI